MRRGRRPPGFERGARERALACRRRERPLDSPVEPHDDEVRAASRRADVRPDQLGECGRGAGPGRRGVESGQAHVRVGEERDAKAADGADAGSPRRGEVRAATGSSDAVLPRVADRVAERDASVVERVVVRERHDVHPREARRRAERARRTSEGVLLRDGRAAGRDGGLEVGGRRSARRRTGATESQG